MPNPHLSLEILYSLQETMEINDAVVFSGVLDIFLENTSYLVGIIQDTYRHTDQTPMISAVHTLQSSSISFGAIPLSLLCKELKETIEKHIEACEEYKKKKTQTIDGAIRLKVEEITEEYIKVYHSLLEERDKLLAY